MADMKQVMTKHGGKAAVGVAALVFGWAVWSFFTQGAASDKLVKDANQQVTAAQDRVNLNRANRVHYKKPLAAQFQAPWASYDGPMMFDIQEPDWAFYHPPKITLRFVKDKGEAQFLATPANIQTVSAPGKITVEWTWNQTPEKKLIAAGFRVYRKAGGGDWELIQDGIGSTTRVYEDKSVKRNVKYFYAVTAMTGGGAEQSSETEIEASVSSQVVAQADVSIELTGVISSGDIAIASFNVTVYRDGKVYTGKASNVKLEENVVVERLQTEDKSETIKEKIDTQYQLVELKKTPDGQDCAVVKDLVTGEKLEKVK